MIEALMAAMVVASSYPSPITPAAEGKVMCFRPDTARKTCMSTGTYVDNGDGTFTNAATMLLSRQPVMVMRAKTIVTGKKDAVCGSIHADNISSGILTVDGKTLSASEARPIIDHLIATLFSGIIDREICTTYVRTDDQLMSKATLEGQPFGVDAVVQWVDSHEGYTVAP